MKRIFLTIFIVSIFTTVFGQKTEYRLSFNSGLFSFTGKSAQPVSFINNAEHLNIAYTNNPYGSAPGICYGFSGNLKRVSKSKFVFGFDLGYELLKSKIAIDYIAGYNGVATYQYSAKGQTFLKFNFINLEPFAGYRFILKQVNLDITGGIDFGYCLNAHENGSATATNGTTYKTSLDRTTIKTDIRPRLQLSADYKKFGVYAGYSAGLVNYKSGYIGGTNDCYSGLFRFGMTYQLK
jgi:hypothetical protein